MGSFFARLDEKHKLLGNFEIFDKNSLEKLNYLFFYFYFFFENLLLKIELSEIIAFFYTHFFGFGGGGFPTFPPGYALVCTSLNITITKHLSYPAWPEDNCNPIQNILLDYASKIIYACKTRFHRAIGKRYACIVDQFKKEGGNFQWFRKICNYSKRCLKLSISNMIRVFWLTFVIEMYFHLAI